jgi:hypothetical protein
MTQVEKTISQYELRARYDVMILGDLLRLASGVEEEIAE